METSLPTPMTARVYVYLPEGKSWIIILSCQDQADKEESVDLKEMQLEISGGWWGFYPWKNSDLNVFLQKMGIELDMIISCWRCSQVILVVKRGIMDYIQLGNPS